MARLLNPREACCNSRPMCFWRNSWNCSISIPSELIFSPLDKLESVPYYYSKVRLLLNLLYCIFLFQERQVQWRWKTLTTRRERNGYCSNGPNDDPSRGDGRMQSIHSRDRRLRKGERAGNTSVYGSTRGREP